MARRPIRHKEILNPDRILNNLLKDYVEGALDDYSFLYRAVVVEVDHLGGVLEETTPNPKNSIRARVITNARDKDLETEELSVFWPLFSHDIMPVKKGEHVYVIFEDAHDKSHGLWLTRIPEPANVDSKNLTPGNKKYEEDGTNDFSSVGADQAVQDTDEQPEKIEIVDEDVFTTEAVQPFRARMGDRVIEGSNNTIIVLGRDRPSDENSGQADAAGTIDVVAGRSDEENMNFANDKSRIYISSLTDIDTNLGTKNDPGDAVDGEAAIILKSDQIRIIARNGTKIVVEGGDLHLEGTNIFIGTDAEESAVLGDKWKTYFSKFLDTWAKTHVHPTPAGPSGPPSAAPPPFDDGSLSKTVKIKK